MRRILLSLLAAVLLTVGVGVASVGATPAHPHATKVKGVITENGAKVKGATVTVTCNGTTKVTTSDKHGAYSVTFPAVASVLHGNPCPIGDTAKVMAQKGGESGVASKTVHSGNCDLNLAIVNVSIPEYGLIGALTAGGAGFGLIAFTRRRQLRQV